MSESDNSIQGLPQLRRDIQPPHDLWPGIEARLLRRRGRSGMAPWLGLALAASLLAAVAIPLQQQGGVLPMASVSGGETRPDFFAAQFRELEGAQLELLLALELMPQSPALRRLLENTRQRQRELRRLALAHA